MLALVPMAGLHFKRIDLISSAKTYVGLQFLFVSLSYLCLTFCLLNDDFSVVYVVNNSSILLPWFYKLCAVWGGHEGSMLLWVAILSLWMVLVAFLSSSLDKEMLSVPVLTKRCRPVF